MLSGEKPFIFSGILKFVGAKVKIKAICKNSADISVIESKKEFTVITGIFTDWKYASLPSDGLSEINEYANDLNNIFPIGELDINSDPETVQIISNTLDFLEENCEIGVFPCSWIAAAAARIGRGQFAYRTLYEKGIDHLLRSNALTAEETDRFMNYCLIGRQPLYYPCMMEFTGEMLAAVNEMLLQSPQQHHPYISRNSRR